METILKASKPLEIQVEREPMWDGNGHMPIMSISQTPVEREPMWDGNEWWVNGVKWADMLSENQCGMETGYIRYDDGVPSLSENQCGMETMPNVLFLACLRVEREPMWDGN